MTKVQPASLNLWTNCCFVLTLMTHSLLLPLSLILSHQRLQQLYSFHSPLFHISLHHFIHYWCDGLLIKQARSLQSAETQTDDEGPYK